MEQQFIPAEVAGKKELLNLPTQAESDLAMAMSITVDSADMADICGDMLNSVATRRKLIEEERFSITRPMDAAKEKVMSFFRRALDPLSQAEQICRTKLGEWARLEKERVAREVRAAEEKARREREEADAAARKARDEEIRAREEAERLQREADERGDAATLKAAQEATRAADAKAEQTEAFEANAQASLIAPPAVVDPGRRVAGVSFTPSWGAECTDKAALIRAAATNEALQCLLKVDQSALNAYAKAQRGAVAVPGVRFFDKTSTKVRASRATK